MPLEDERPTAESEQSPWTRLRGAVEYAFTKGDPDQPVPPAPRELKQWAEYTSLSVGVGILYAGVREWARVRSLPPIEHPAHAVNKAQAARLIAEENTVRVLRVQRAAVSGGFRFGALTGLFVGVQLSSAYARNLVDVWNSVYAGSATGASVGLLLPYSPLYRLGSGALGALAGGLLSYPTGLLQLRVEPWVDDLTKSWTQNGNESSAKQEHEIKWEVIDGQYKPVLPSSPDGTTQNVIELLEKSLEQPASQDGSREGGETERDRRQNWLSRWLFPVNPAQQPQHAHHASSSKGEEQKTADGTEEHFQLQVPERYRHR